LIAYFIGNISAKKYQNPFMCVKVIASQRWDVFETSTATFVRPISHSTRETLANWPTFYKFLFFSYKSSHQ